MPLLPSLVLLSDETSAELAAYERRVDGLDSKAGVLLGFSGVIVALSASNLHGVPAYLSTILAGIAAILSGLAFVPRRFPALELLALRNFYLTAGRVHTAASPRHPHHHGAAGEGGTEMEGTFRDVCRLQPWIGRCACRHLAYNWALTEGVGMSEKEQSTKGHSTGSGRPAFDPDDRLMSDREGNSAAVRAYRRAAIEMRRMGSKSE